MKKYYPAILLVYLLYFCAPNPASAQRTMSGQLSLQANLLYNGQSAGAEAFFGGYTLNGYWNTGVSTQLYAIPLSTGIRMNSVQAYACGGYMYRIAATRSRSLSLYGGAGFLAGAEIHDPLGRLPRYIDTGISSLSFIYGLYGRGEMEWFLSRKFSLSLSASAPLTFGSPTGVIRWNVALGCKFNI